MKKKIFILLTVSFLLFSGCHYWENRYVELRPVISKGYDRQIVFFQNDYYRFAKPNEVSPNYYKHIRFVLDRSNIDYIEENGIIYVRKKFFNDMELAWNYTNRATSVEFFKQEREMDSLHLISNKKYTESQKKIIDSYLKELKTSNK